MLLRKSFDPTAALQVALLPIVIIYVVLPVTWRRPVDVPCLFTRLFGIHCPGCGLKSSITALLSGDLHTSLAINPLGMPTFACIFLVFIEGAGELARVWGLQDGGTDNH